MATVMGRKQNILIVGAGLAGATAARILAEEGHQIRIIDKRDHIGGNTYDYIDTKSGIRIHKYGPHIFHTNNKKVFDWVTQFSEWQPYKHIVSAQLSSGQLVPFPPNLDTIKIVDHSKLPETFFVPYTEKMWGTKYQEVDKDTINRIKIKNNTDPYYFQDKYQILPINGYTHFVRNLLNHNNIDIQLQTKFQIHMLDDFDYCFNSMSIDEFYNYKFGMLDYRSLKFNNIHLPVQRLFATSVVNFTDTGPYTRVTEWKNFPNSPPSYSTVITLEQPCNFKDNEYERYYPIKSNRNLYRLYSDVKNDKVQFIGRCGLYAYLDMDMAIYSTMVIIKKYLKKNR